MADEKPKTTTSTLAITYGEDTKLSPRVCSAAFHVTTAPAQLLAIVTTTLKVCNDSVATDIEAALRFPLPNSDAVVCGFRVDGDAAIAVPKAKAAAVAYKEKEKGRAVATAANVSGAVWETTVYPLPHKVEVEIIVTFVCALDDTPEQLSLTLPITFSAPVASISVTCDANDGSIVKDSLNGAVRGSTMPDGLHVKFTAPASPRLPVISAMQGGHVYFNARVPKEAIDNAFAEQHAGAEAATTDKPHSTGPAHIGIIVDTSRSAASMADVRLDVLDALRESYASLGRSVTVSLWAFSRRATALGHRLSVEEAKGALKALRYDGGTDLSLLTHLLAQAGLHGGGDLDGCEAIVLLTDGVGNLLAKQLPDLKTPATTSVPVHVALPSKDINANLGLLRWFAYQTGGSASGTLLEPRKFADRVSGALATTVLTRLATDLSTDVEAFEDDAFVTAPDFRLARLHEPAAADGSIHVSGVCDPTSRLPPSSLTLTLKRADAEATLTLPIAPSRPPRLSSPVLLLSHSLPADDAALGRLLHVKHALMCIDQLQKESFDPEAAKAAATAVACSAGIASEHSSLLKLSSPEQFAEYDLECPADHAAHTQWKVLVEQRAKEKAVREADEAMTAAKKLQRTVAPMVTRYNAMVQSKPANWGKRLAQDGSRKNGRRTSGSNNGSNRCASSDLSRRSGNIVSACNFTESLASSAAEELNQSDDEADDDWGCDIMGMEEEEGEGAIEDAMVDSMENEVCAAVGAPTSPPPLAPPPAMQAEAPVYRSMTDEYDPSIEEHLSDASHLRDAGLDSLNACSQSLAALDSLNDCSQSLAAATNTFLAPKRRASSSIGGVIASVTSSIGSLVNRSRNRSDSDSAGESKPRLAAVHGDPAVASLCSRYPWLKSVLTAHEAVGVDGALSAFDEALAAEPSLSGLPSTFIAASELLHALGVKPDLCADMLFNVLESRLPDTQTCRVVAYHLLSLGRLDDAVLLLELIREVLAPAEPHSFSDLAFARFHRLRAQATDAPSSGAADSDRRRAMWIRDEMSKVVSDLTEVVVSTAWASRFAEIEWPALILLSWAVAWADDQLVATEEGTASMWPEEALPAAQYRLGAEKGPQLDIFVWLGWDTDYTDVDLHVKEPTGEEVYYSHNHSSTTGAHVSRDFTQGYGPEVYTLPEAPKGTYDIETNYYASHQANASATGATSAVVWSIKNMGRFDREEVQFETVRLGSHKQRQRVMLVEI